MELKLGLIKQTPSVHIDVYQAILPSSLQSHPE